MLNGLPYVPYTSSNNQQVFEVSMLRNAILGICSVTVVASEYCIRFLPSIVWPTARDIVGPLLFLLNMEGIVAIIFYMQYDDRLMYVLRS